MDEPPRLLHFRISHFNEKVRWALDHKKWPHVREALTPGFHILPLRLSTGQSKVPVLVIDGKPVVGSAVILDEIERRRPDPPLFPDDPAKRARAAEIQKYFDDEVAPDARRLFWAAYIDHPAACARMATMGSGGGKRAVWRVLFPIVRVGVRRNIGLTTELLERARARLRGHFDRLESEIGPSGFLVGDTFGVADISAASMMSAVLRPPQFPYPLPEPRPQELVDLIGSVADHPGAQWVFRMYETQRPPSAESVRSRSVDQAPL